MKTEILSPSPQNIEICARHILEGELVAFPTETVYGLGANALMPTSVQKIYEAKGRPSDNPLIVHLADKSQIDSYAHLTDDARLLVDAFMSGPITILLKKKDCIPNIVTANRDTVGIRIPENEIGRAFLRACGVPVCAPSANTSTRPSPTQAKHVQDDLEGKIRYILDGGSCDIGIESTIIDVSTASPILLRKGKISASQIESLLKKKVILADSAEEALSPGLKYKHYSPRASVIMVKNSASADSKIKEIYHKNVALGYKTVIMCYNNQANDYENLNVRVTGDDKDEQAKNFYRILRELDKEGTDVIIYKAPNESEIGAALFNRMFKAAGSKIVE